MSNEVKVGIVVVSAMIIFVVVFLSVASVQLSGSLVEYRTYFKFAGGLDSGTLVRFGGRKAGVISDVHPAPDDPTTNEVVFQVREDVPVNEDSLAKIGSLNALGDNYLEISPGTKDAARMPPGSTIPSDEMTSFSDITSQVAEVTETANSVLLSLRDDVSLLVLDLRGLTANLQELTNEQNQQNIQSMLENANNLFETQDPKIDQITTQVSDMLARVEETVAQMKRVGETAETTVSNVNRTVEETREPIKQDLAQLEATLVEAREMLEEVRALVVANDANISETIENFRATSENLEQFSDEIRQRPWSLLRTKPKLDRAVPATAP
ncbi:MAG: MlaD family protein [Acidobacteria bacterium]|nr:MlaD family protein [Acidobacteriota bacterium]MDA1233397.1 MlaD family protein [Acidobacteriota bacterium]